MGKFTNSTYTNTIANLAEASTAKLINPYYKFTDKSPTEVVYYKQNLEKSTLDSATATNYQHIGEQSPIRFNKINNFVLYGLGRIELNYEVSDYGLESGEIVGDAVVLPNTIIPTQGDFFYVPYIKEDALFKVNSVTKDTLDNGSNFYKIEYKLELINERENIEKQVVKEYNFIASNVGTDFNALISSTDYDMANSLESLIGDLTNLYKTFFDSSVQSFVFRHNGYLMYDPYMIEFMIRTKIMSYADEYFYLDHAAYVPRSFDYDYSRTIFAALENKSSLEPCKNIASATKIEDINSLFVTRVEDYYMISINNPYYSITKFDMLDMDTITNSFNGEYFDKSDSRYVYNIMIAYLNDDSDYIGENVLDIIKAMEYVNNKDYFYAIPITMYVLIKYIESLMK